jgi:hypothetical protein
MALILAVEPDRHQASQLQAIARSRLHAELVIEATAERALAALGDRIPDLILTAALLSPKDEAALAERLRALHSAAAHIHTLTIPVLAAPRSRPRMGGVLSALRRERPQASEPDGCDPAVFAEQCATYLERAMAERAELAETTSPARTTDYEETGLVVEEPAHVLDETAREPFAVLHPSTLDGLDTFTAEAGEEIRALVDEPVERHREESLEAVISEPIDEPVVEDLVDVVEQSLVEAGLDEVSLDEPVVEEPWTTPVVEEEEPWATPIVEEIVPPMVDEVATPVVEDTVTPMVDEIVDRPAVVDATPSMRDDDVVLEDSPLFELVSEAESENGGGNEEDLDRYIELDLSEFLDQSTPMVHSMVASGNDASLEAPMEEDDATATAGTPMDAGPAQERRPIAAQIPDSPAAEPDEADWLEVVEALRRDVERLDATPVAPPRPPRPLKKAPRKPLKGKPIQDEWGFFDPEQCGFAALLAKLDEVTKADNPVRRKRG